MENLINFDESIEEEKKKVKKSKTPKKHPFVDDKHRVSLELDSNPFDKMEYRITHYADPFECLEVSKTKSQQNSQEILEETEEESRLRKESLASLISNVSSIEHPSLLFSPSGSTFNNAFVDNNKSEPSIIQNSCNPMNNAFITNSSLQSLNEVVNKRSQSETSTTSNQEGARSRFHSVDTVLSNKHNSNQLLKLSLLNSPSTPLYSSSFNNSSLVDSVFMEAKKTSEKFKSMGDSTFEDLNNISQQLLDTPNVSQVDADMEQFKVSFLENNPESSSITPTSEKINNIQEKLKKIKQEKIEEERESSGLIIKHELATPPKNEMSEKKPSQADLEVDDILTKIKSLIKNNNKDEAKKHLQKLNALLGSSDAASLQIPAIVRQDTFDIDSNTGKRKYCSNGQHVGDGDHNSSNGSDIMEQLAKLLGAQTIDVGSLNFSSAGNNHSDAKVMLIVPKMPTPNPISTPVKQQNNPARRSVSFSAQRPQSSLKAMESKKLSTPMKHSSLAPASAARRSSLSFTAPRSLAKPSNPYDQKVNIGAVRKSLIGSIDKSPTKPKSSPVKPRPPTVRRSISLKSTIPSIKLSEPSPSKTRPVTSTPTPNKNTRASISRTTSTPQNRRLSTAQTTSRPPTSSRPSLSFNRPSTQKTEFKTPYASSKLSSSSKDSSLV